MDKFMLHLILASLLTVELLYLEVLKRHFLAVLADCLNALAVGAPAVPGLRIFSPDPEAIRARLAWMFAYNPFLGFLITISPYQTSMPQTFYHWLCFYDDEP
tara:strand:- start:213 stop:518 length:306 start_codon:yes stop_codon:yes gene_type:complete